MRLSTWHVAMPLRPVLRALNTWLMFLCLRPVSEKLTMEPMPYVPTAMLEICALRHATRSVGEEHKVCFWKGEDYSNDFVLEARSNRHTTRSLEYKLEACILRHASCLSDTSINVHVHYELRPKAVQTRVPSTTSTQTRNIEVPCLTQQKSRLEWRPRLILRFFKKSSTSDSPQDQRTFYAGG